MCKFMDLYKILFILIFILKGFIFLIIYKFKVYDIFVLIFGNFLNFDVNNKLE